MINLLKYILQGGNQYLDQELFDRLFEETGLYRLVGRHVYSLLIIRTQISFMELKPLNQQKLLTRHESQSSTINSSYYRHHMFLVVNYCRCTRGQFSPSLVNHRRAEIKYVRLIPNTAGERLQAETTEPVRLPPGHAYQRDQSHLCHAHTHTQLSLSLTPVQ